MLSAAERDPAYSLFLSSLAKAIYRHTYILQTSFMSSLGEVGWALREGKLANHPHFEFDSKTAEHDGANTVWTRAIHHMQQGWTIYYQRDGEFMPDIEETRCLYAIPRDEVLAPCYFPDENLVWLIHDPKEHFLRLSHEH